MKFDARKLMERAIDVVRQSVDEPRTDGKTSPKVGAVLYKPDGTVETACRGELRHGDHAEFTLLERKNRNRRLDGSLLFATLEPCAPGSRRHPKVDCAERIRLARIRKVWVGIQDPDPTVARKGIQHLLDHGIEVEMFDRDLQEAIEKENGDFLRQANDRAAEVRKKPTKILLSPLENKLHATVLKDFSHEALEFFRSRAGIADNPDSPDFNRRLLQQGLLKEEADDWVPTGFGMILFGKEPRRSIPQAGLLVSLRYPNGDQERREFDEPAVLIPDLLEQWLKDKLPNVFDRSRMQREHRPALPFEMVREAVVNALIHRDYGIEGAKCQITVNEDTIVVRSPGPPPPPITMKQMQDFSSPMLSRNPALHFVFARMGMAEEQGLGLDSLKQQAQKLGLPLPRYTWGAPYLVLTLYRSKEAAAKRLAKKSFDSLSKSEKKGWEWIVASGKPVTALEYSVAMDMPKRTALNHLQHFTQIGLIRPVGTGRAVRYVIVA